MATDVFYNGVCLHNVVTRQWDQTVEYDESNTDALRHKFRLSFEGILHAQSPDESQNLTAPAWIGDDTGGVSADAPKTLDAVRRRLCVPRRVLLINVNDERLLACGPFSTRYHIQPPDRDVANGPKPLEVNVTHVISDQVFRVQFTIECTKLECVSERIPPIVLNNRWSITEAQDENCFIIRTVRGRVTFSASEIHHAMFKGMVIPGLENGFKRQRVEFTVTPDGLAATYAVTDRQVHTAAPWPATKISGTHTEATGDGVTLISDCSILLEGRPNADKTQLITRAVQIADSRLNLLDDKGQAQINKTYQLLSGAIVDHFGERNAIEVRMRIRHLKEDLSETFNFWFRARTKTLGSALKLPSVRGEPEAYNPTVSLNPALHGYNPQDHPQNVRDPAELFILNCYLQEPCSNRHGVGYFEPASDEQNDDKQDPNYPRYPVIKTTGPLGETDDDPYSPETKTAVYTMARMESRYLQRGLNAALPIARSDETEEADAFDEFGEVAAADTCVVIDLAQPQAVREISYDAERVGEYPQYPKPLRTYKSGTITATRLDHWVRVHPPVVSPDGVTLVYRLAAFYRYSLNRFPLPGDTLPVGVLPHTSLELDDTALAIDEAQKEDML